MATTTSGNTYFASALDVNLVRNVFVPSYRFDAGLGQFVVELKTNLQGNVAIGDASTNYALTVNTTPVQLALPNGSNWGDYLFWNPSSNAYVVGSKNITLGCNAGQTNQGNNAVALGAYAGNISQGRNSIAIGLFAGQRSQISNSIILNATGTEMNAPTLSGFYVAPIRSASQAQILGYNTISKEITFMRYPTQGDILPPGSNWGSYLFWDGISSYIVGNDNITLGCNAGQTRQGSNAVALGANAGNVSQGSNSVAVGWEAGKTSQGPQSVAVGNNAGNASQGAGCVAVGGGAGEIRQEPRAIAIGGDAGEDRQGTESVAIGYLAGQSNQGIYSIAIGSSAGKTSQISNSIILNATGAELTALTLSGFYVAPIRSASQAQILGYNTISKEITFMRYPTQGDILPPGSNWGEYLFWNPSSNAYVVGSKNITLGCNAGQTGQGTNAVALGAHAGKSLQGNYSIAIGNSAGETSQFSNSIILNASSNALNADAIGFYVAPIRTASQAPSSTSLLGYNPSRSEISQVSVGSGLSLTGGILAASGGGTGTAVQSYLFRVGAPVPTGVTPVGTGTLIAGTTYTVPVTGFSFIQGLVLGGGGGGAGGGNRNNLDEPATHYAAGGGGGGGAGTGLQIFFPLTGTTITITIGAGGAGGEAGDNGNAGVAGQPSTLGVGPTTFTGAEGTGGSGGGGGGSRLGNGFGGAGGSVGGQAGTSSADITSTTNGGGGGTGGAYTGYTRAAGGVGGTLTGDIPSSAGTSATLFGGGGGGGGGGAGSEGPNSARGSRGGAGFSGFVYLLLT